ncbi:hypothetical protein AAH978_18260 [Streptomyces sp. ZYX-F-203]
MPSLSRPLARPAVDARTPRGFGSLTPLLLTLFLTACGTERDAASPSERAGEAATSDATASDAEIVRRAGSGGAAPELVHLTEVPGYRLAERSVGVHGDDGFSAVYVPHEGPGSFTLRVERGDLDADSCEERWNTCEQDGGLWRLETGRAHGYARPESGYVVGVTADREEVPLDHLRAAIDAVRHAEAGPVPPPADPAATRPPVERGDLPPHGDGAPYNGVGAGG